MTGIGFNSNQCGCRATLSALERGRKFEGMCGHHAIIVIPGGNQRGWVTCAGLQIVQGRITEQGFEHLAAVITSAVIKRPASTGRKGVIAQHV